MKFEKVFTITSLVAFFALLPALIILEVRVLRALPEIAYLFIIIDIILVAFIVVETILLVRKWRKEKEHPTTKKEGSPLVAIEQEWGKSKEEEEGKEKKEETPKDGEKE